MLDFTRWGPLTVLAVSAALLLLVGGVVNVIVDTEYTFRAFLDDLKWFAGAAVAGTAAGTGILKGLERVQPAVIAPNANVVPESYPGEADGGEEPGDPPIRPVR